MFCMKIFFSTSDNPVVLPKLQCLDKAAGTVAPGFHMMMAVKKIFFFCCLFLTTVVLKCYFLIFIWHYIYILHVLHVSLTNIIWHLYCIFVWVAVVLRWHSSSYWYRCRKQGKINPQLTKLHLVNVNHHNSNVSGWHILSGAWKPFASPVKQKEADI